MISGTLSRIKILLGIVALTSFFQSALAQESTLDVPDSTINKDSIKTIQMLVVPFNPSMYFSDADNDIGEISKIQPGQVRNRLSSSLEVTVTEHLDLYYDVKSISKQKDLGEDLDIIFGSLQYTPQEIKSAEPEKKGGIKGIRDKVKPKEDDPSKKKDPETYMDISFSDGRLMKYISEKYGVDYVIFFNQFEIKTDYENCIDLQMRNYYREIKVHYSVYSKDGKHINGDVITLPYNSNENNIEVIVKENFGQISDILFKRLYLQK